MAEDTLLYLADFGQSLVIILTLAGYVPQWAELIRTKDSGSMSSRAWTLWFCSGGLGWFYAIVQVSVHGTGYMLLATSTIIQLCMATTLLMLVRYRPDSVDREANAESLLDDYVMQANEREEEQFMPTPRSFPTSAFEQVEHVH